MNRLFEALAYLLITVMLIVVIPIMLLSTVIAVPIYGLQRIVQLFTRDAFDEDSICD